METFTHKRTGKTFTIGGHAKIIYCKDYLHGLGAYLEDYKIGQTVKIVGYNSGFGNWPFVEGIKKEIDPDCLEPLPSTEEQIQSEIAKREKEIEELKFQLTQLTLKES